MTPLRLSPAPDPLSNLWGQLPQTGSTAGREGAAKRLCLQPARTQLSSAGKAGNTSPIYEHKHLLGACSETPAQAVKLPASLF